MFPYPLATPCGRSECLLATKLIDAETRTEIQLGVFVLASERRIEKALSQAAGGCANIELDEVSRDVPTGEVGDRHDETVSSPPLLCDRHRDLEDLSIRGWVRVEVCRWRLVGERHAG